MIRMLNNSALMTTRVLNSNIVGEVLGKSDSKKKAIRRKMMTKKKGKIRGIVVLLHREVQFV